MAGSSTGWELGVETTSRCLHKELEASNDALVLELRKPSLGWSMGLGPTLTVLLLLGMALRLMVSCP
jgi:hypothetical protein